MSEDEYKTLKDWEETKKRVYSAAVGTSLGSRLEKQRKLIQRCEEANEKPDPEKCMVCSAYLSCPLVLEEVKKARTW
jgi:hypothetical protein